MALVEAIIVGGTCMGVSGITFAGFRSWITLERERMREASDGAARDARMTTLAERMDVHESALKNVLAEIHAKFVDHEQRLERVTSEAATVVAGTVDAMSHVPTWGR